MQLRQYHDVMSQFLPHNFLLLSEDIVEGKPVAV